MADDSVTHVEAVTAGAAQDRFAELVDAMLLQGLPQHGIVGGMMAALSEEMQRLGGAAGAAASLRAFADEIEADAAARRGDPRAAD